MTPSKWAHSIFDELWHLLVPEGDHPLGALAARCGAVLPQRATQFEKRPHGAACGICVAMHMADELYRQRCCKP